MDQLISLDLHVQDFEEYLNLQSQTFVQYYRCLPLSLLHKENADEDGNRGKLAFCFLSFFTSNFFFFFFFWRMQCSNLLLLHLNFAVIMPLSALDRLGGLNIEYPMLFQIKHPITERATHCGVLEFVADEGFIHMPSWVTTNRPSNTIHGSCDW